jgi:two-component system nitrate/nitrite response regulator NarL
LLHPASNCRGAVQLARGAALINRNIERETRTLAKAETGDRVESATVPTVLLCQNNLLRAGFTHFLLGTRFVISDGKSNTSCQFPCLILICVSLTTENSLKCVDDLKAEHPDARIVIIAEQLATEAIINLWRIGLSGFFQPNMAREAMVNALELVASGEAFIASAFLTQLVDRSIRPNRQGSRSADSLLTDSVAKQSKDLSARETQILRYLMKGATNKIIAQELGLSEATVKVHVKAVLKKMNATNRTQAATWATASLNNTPSSS